MWINLKEKKMPKIKISNKFVEVIGKYCGVYHRIDKGSSSFRQKLTFLQKNLKQHKV